MVNTPYFYSGQLRTLFLHFTRIFSGFQVNTGPDSNGYDTFKKVPAVWGDIDRQVAGIINQNSENVVKTVPMIACYVTNLELARERASWAANQQDLLVTERRFDKETGHYTQEHGHDYHVQYLHPNPLDITMKVDVWTSNTDQKCQLFEQFYIIFNPSFDMQINTNPLHPTPIKRVILTDIIWDNQGIPKGADDQPDVMSFVFKIEADIMPPAKIKRQKLINTVINEMINGDLSTEPIFDWDSSEVNHVLVTPGNHSISVNGAEITLLGPNGTLTDENGDVYSWPQLIDEYGELQVNFSKLSLKWTGNLYDDSEDIYGKIELDPVIDNILHFTVDYDTLPATTLQDVNAVINPHERFPGTDLPAALSGQRYIITEDLGNSVAWGALGANRNDIIEYDGSIWSVVYDASASITDDVVNNIETGHRLKLNNDTFEWIDLLNLNFNAGYWRLFL